MATRHSVTRERLSRRRFCALPVMFAMSADLSALERPIKGVQIGVLSTGRNDIKVYRALRSQLDDAVPELALTVTYREAAFSQEQLAAQFDELLAQRLDVLICLDLFAANFAKFRRRPDSTPPIVFLAHADPIADHLIQAYAEPGNNLTGVTTYRCMDGKLVEVMAEAFPKRKRFGYFVDTSNDDKDCIQLAEEAAVRGQVELVKIDVSATQFLSKLRTTLSTLHVDAVIAPASAPVWQNSKAVVDTVNSERLPTIYESTVFLEVGGLMSYGTIARNSISQVVRAVRKILRGEPAGSIPVEQPTLFELVINLRAPHVPEYEFKAATLRRADRILE